MWCFVMSAAETPVAQRRAHFVPRASASYPFRNKERRPEPIAIGHDVENVWMCLLERS